MNSHFYRFRNRRLSSFHLVGEEFLDEAIPGCTFVRYPKLLTHGYSKFLFNLILAATQGLSEKSRQALWFVPSRCTCSYEYGPKHLKQLGEDISYIVKLPIRLDSVNCNIYYGPKQQLKWHSDDEKLMGKRPYIFSLSLGASRTFGVRDISAHRMSTIELHNADGLLMAGLAQAKTQHAVLPSSASDDTNQIRINLTFRFIDQHKPGCPYTNSAYGDGWGRLG